MKISSNFNLKKVIENEIYDVDYGVLTKGSNTTVEVLFKDVEHLLVKATCGCTTPEIVLLPEGGFNLVIKYDNNKMGIINQAVTERVLDKNNNELVVTFRLKGQIV